MAMHIPRPVIYLAAVLVFLSLPLWIRADYLGASEYYAADGSIKAKDFLIFYTAGQLANEGRAVDAYNFRVFLTAINQQLGQPPPDPATTPAFSTEWPVYLYSPPLTVTFRPLAQLSYSTALAIWRLATLLAILAAMWLLRRSLPILQRYPFWVLVLFALGFCPVNIVFGNGQNGAFSLLLFALAFYLTQPRYHGRYDWLAGAIGAALALEKAQLVVGLLLLWLLCARWRALVGMVVGGAVICFLTVLVLPPATFAGWLGNLLAFSAAGAHAPIAVADITVLALLRMALPFAGDAVSLLYYGYLAAVLIALAVAVRRLMGARLEENRRHWWLYLLAALFSIISPNYVRLYDMTLLLVPLLLLFALYDGAGQAMRLRLILLAASLYGGILAFHELSGPTHVQFAGLLSLAFAAYAGFLLYHDLAGAQRGWIFTGSADPTVLPPG